MTPALLSAPFSWYETPDDVLRRLSPAWRARPDKRVLSRHVPKRRSRYMRSTRVPMSFDARLALQKRGEP